MKAFTGRSTFPSWDRARDALLVIAGVKPGLTQRYEQAQSASVTYPEVGATRSGDLPSGYHHIRRRLRLGSGTATFERAGRHLRAWAPQLGAGLRVHPADASQEAGSTVLVLIGFGWLALVAPCRVVWTLNEPNRVGFGYGTLPGHPVCGEECFVVELDDEGGDVSFAITAFSRPAAWYTRLAGPIAGLVQHRITTAYLYALLDPW